MKILLLGDVMLGENMFHLKRGIFTHFADNFDNIIAPSVTDSLFASCSAVFLNMEYSLVDNLNKKLHPSEKVYRSDPNSLSFIDKGPIKIFNIANNHFSQHGKESSVFTKSILSENGIEYVGDEHDPIVVEQDHRKYIFWGFSLVDDPQFCGEYNLTNFDNLLQRVPEKKKTDNEFWTISLHWGDEYVSNPSPKQIDVAHRLVENGFDLIIGHHPHVIQPVEFYNGSLIVYSLGNFIFDQNFSKETTTGLAALVNTQDLSGSKFFKTEQSNYKVIKSYEIKPPLRYSEYSIDEYADISKRMHQKYRQKKRLEYLRNFYHSDVKIIPFLINKVLKKKFLTH